MPKGYWVARMTVTNPDGYPAYQAANAAAFKTFGAKFLVRGGAFEAVEGEARERHVIIEFESIEQARACYFSPEYQEAIKLRNLCATGDLMIIEGVE